MPTKIKKPFYKRVWFWILVVIVIFLAIGANGSKTNNSTSSKDQTSKTKSKPKYAEVNKDLAKALKKDQSYANDDPTNFGYAKYIESIKYTGGSDITVNVNGAFKDVDNDVKTDVMNQTQNLVKMVLLNDKKISDDNAGEGLVVLVNNGGNSIGTSKALNHKEYSWD